MAEDMMTWILTLVTVIVLRRPVMIGRNVVSLNSHATVRITLFRLLCFVGIGVGASMVGDGCCSEKTH